MKTSLVSVSVVATLAVVLSFPNGERTPLTHADGSANSTGTKLISRLPVAFVPNLGQWEHAARYVARVGAMNVFLEPGGWTFTLSEKTRGVAVRMSFAGASAPELVAEQQLPGRHNFFLGSDPTKWRSDVPLYRSVRYREVQRGVDVRARTHDGHFEYDLLLRPDADLGAIEIGVEGIERMRLDGDALVMETGVGEVRMPAPASWEEGPSRERSPIACRYVLRGASRFGFAVAARRSGWELVVDPGLVWSTFLGADSAELITGVAVTANGAVVVAGMTNSQYFPTTPGAYDRSYNGGTFWGGDAFVSRLSSDGTKLEYSSFLGGPNDEMLSPGGLALDVQGAPTLVGYTPTPFPTTPGAFDTINTGGSEGFVTRFSANGASLVYSTYLGGAGNDWVDAIAIDARGAATVAGYTGSLDFPTTPGAYDTSYNAGNFDAFVARLAPDGASLELSSYLGGSDSDYASDVALGPRGEITVIGSTFSTDFPAVAAFDPTPNGARDGFVARLSSDGASLLSSTYLGGAGDEHPWRVVIDEQGAAIVAGETISADFPTVPGSFDTTLGGYEDAFVTRFAPSGTSLVFSTFFGAVGGESAYDLVLDPQGTFSLTGRTTSPDLPTTPGAFSRGYSGPVYPGDAFVARLTSSGTALVYSTFLGGGQADYGYALARDGRGGVVAAGTTESYAFPVTPGAYDTTANGSQDGFVTRLDMLPTGASLYGRASPGCAGAPVISVSSMPRVGNAAFALACGNAPPGANGALVLAASFVTTPIWWQGADLWLDPGGAFFVGVSAGSDSRGICDFPLAIPNQPWLAQLRLCTQFFWLGPTGPPPCPPLGMSATDALAIMIQP